MVNGIRRVSVERGYDPRDFVLNCAGGATGAHVTALAREMGIRKVLVSRLASGLCAFGQIISDVKYNYMAPVAARLEGAASAARLNDLFTGLEAQGRADLARDGFPPDRIGVRRSLDMRYVGQVHECTVEVPAFDIDESALDRLKAAFHARHEELYTYSEPQSPVEVVNVESAVSGTVDRPMRTAMPPGQGAHAALIGTRGMIFDASGQRHETPVHDGARLGAGDIVTGPAVIQEVTTTIVIEPGWTAVLDPAGVYVVTTAEAARPQAAAAPQAALADA